MKAKLAVLGFSVLIFVLFSNSVFAATNPDRKAMELFGCFAHGVWTSADGNLVWTTCESPKGLFYSRNQGQTWNFAEGGAYKGGIIKPVQTTSYGAFVNGGQGTIIKTSIPATADEVWSPNWETTQIHGDTVASIDKWIIVASGSKLQSYDTSTMQMGSEIDFPNSWSLNSGSISLGTSLLYLSISSSDGSDHDFVRTTFNSQTGAFGTWTNLDASLPANTYVSWLAATPEDSAFISVYGLDGNRDDNTLYTIPGNSTVLGTSGLTFQARCAGFGGGKYLIENWISDDQGLSWRQISEANRYETITTTDVRHCALDPVDGSWALLQTTLGWDRVSNINSTNGTGTWENADEGLTAVATTGIVKSPVESGRAIVQTRGGLAYSDNLFDAEPTWQFPFEPAGSADNTWAAFDQTNPSVFYYNGNGANNGLRKVTLNYNGDVLDSWTNDKLADVPENSYGPFGIWSITTTPYIADTLVVGYVFAQSGKGFDGGLYFYNTSTGAVIRHVLDGHPIFRFFAVNSQTMFASSAIPYGETGVDTSDSDARGMWRSDDGGVTWNKVTDSDFSESIVANTYTYDSTNDILYVVITDDSAQKDAIQGIYRLRNAGHGGTNWEKASALVPGFNGGVAGPSLWETAVTVDTVTGYVYVAGGNTIYGSADQGTTWKEVYQGVDSESTRSMAIDRLDSASSLHAASSSVIMTQASSAGAFKIDLTNLIITNPNATSKVAVWDTRTSKTNILEITNTGSSAASVRYRVYDSSAGLKTDKTISIPAKGQKHINLNSLKATMLNNSGHVRVSSTSSDINGQIVVYKQKSVSAEMEFVYALPLSDSLSGRNGVVYNTSQPSRNILDVNSSVEQWLNLVNLDTSSKSFTVYTYDINGNKIKTRRVTVGAGKKIDLEAGHISVGSGKQGIQMISPSTSSTPYYAQLVRYGQRADISQPYAFAVPVVAQSGGVLPRYINISTGAGAENYVEIANPETTTISAKILAYNPLGQRIMSKTVTIKPKAQRHVGVSALLGNNVSGFAKVYGLNGAKTPLVNSISYYRSNDQRIATAVMSQGRFLEEGPIYTSYNRNFSAENWLRVVNPSATSRVFTIKVYNSSGTKLSQKSVTVGKYKDRDLGLHGSAFGTLVNGYGLVEISAGSLSDLLRIGYTTTGGVDFAFSLPASGQ